MVNSLFPPSRRRRQQDQPVGGPTSNAPSGATPSFAVDPIQSNPDQGGGPGGLNTNTNGLGNGPSGPGNPFGNGGLPGGGPTGNGATDGVTEQLTDPNNAPDKADGPAPIDDLEEQFVRNSFAGPRDTSADEAAARANQQEAMNQSLYNQRASMGAGGFGLGGAQSAVELTQRRKGAMDLTNQILGIQQGARDESFSHGTTGFGLDMQGRSEADKEAKTKAQVDALKAILNGKDGGGESGTGGGGDTGLDEINNALNDSPLAEQSSGQPSAQNPTDPNLPKKTSPGDGDQAVYSSGMGGGAGTYSVYRDSKTGTLYRVEGG